MAITDKSLLYMKNNRYIAGIIISIGIFTFIPFAYAQEEITEPVVEQTAIFSDVDIGHPEYVAIKYLAENDIIKGYKDGSFKPDNLISRAEALKIILEANNLINETYIENNSMGGKDFMTNPLTFNDIYKSVWYYPYIKKAVEAGIVEGYPDGSFKPSNTINRVESLKMIMESDGIILPEVLEDPFADVHTDQWFAPYMLEAKLREIVYVTMQNTVNPGREMTRSRFAELVYRYIKSKENHRFGKASYYSDSLEGYGTSNGETYIASEMTAANKTLPFGTVVRVTNLANGKAVHVRINDRGPFVTGRSLDLSRAAFEEIANPGTGVIWVEYEVLPQE